MCDICEVRVTGKIIDIPAKLLDNGVYSMYEAPMEIERFSGVKDVITLNVKKDKIGLIELLKDKNVVIDGTLRTYKCLDGSSRTVLLVYNIIESDENVNEVNITGTIASIRDTVSSNGVKVCEARIEVNGKYNRMSRITIVGWSSIANKLSSLGTGARINIDGRVQSRKIHKNSGTEYNALEVAIKNLTEDVQA